MTIMSKKSAINLMSKPKESHILMSYVYDNSLLDYSRVDERSTKSLNWNFKFGKFLLWKYERWFLKIQH